MPRTHPPYPPEFKRQMLELALNRPAVKKISRGVFPAWRRFGWFRYP